MLKKMTSLALMCLALVSVNAEITEIYNLDKVWDAVGDLDENSLVILDVDHTLLMPNDMIFHPRAETYRNYLLTISSQNLGPERTEDLMTICMLEMKNNLVDRNMRLLIEAVRKKGALVMALTAMDPGKKGRIDDLAQWRYLQLKEHQIDFSQTFPEANYPLYKHGILFSGKKEKGKVLANFLNHLEWTPSKVIFLDDRLAQVRSVDLELQGKGIEVHAFHYRAAELLPFELNKEKIKFQILYLIQYESWLSDEEILALYNT